MKRQPQLTKIRENAFAELKGSCKYVMYKLNRFITRITGLHEKLILKMNYGKGI